MQPPSNWYQYHQFREQKALEPVQDGVILRKAQWTMTAFKHIIFAVFHTHKFGIKDDLDMCPPDKIIDMNNTIEYQ